MAKRRTRPQAGVSSGRGRGSGGAGGVVLGFVLGGAAACGAGYLYLHGHGRETAVQAPAAVGPVIAGPVTTGPARQAAPGSGSGARATEGAEVGQPPFGSSEEVFEAGARVYAARCASCHGTSRHEAKGTVRGAQLFREGRTQVSAQRPGVIYQAIAQGAPAKGMPAYAGVLTPAQIWQLTLLLESAGEPLPDPVTAILTR